MLNLLWQTFLQLQRAILGVAVAVRWCLGAAMYFGMRRSSCVDTLAEEREIYVLEVGCGLDLFPYQPYTSPLPRAGVGGTHWRQAWAATPEQHSFLTLPLQVRSFIFLCIQPWFNLAKDYGSHMISRIERRFKGAQPLHAFFHPAASITVRRFICAQVPFMYLGFNTFLQFTFPGAG
ncbi:hypothetical protein K438DRAFT_2054759 [Mycena galopus ATCC 62051]|nr:hypothetical protein K438DRAFT_2054759 [Mycena galopus ATCC 62051]